MMDKLKDIHKKKDFWKWVIGLTTPVMCMFVIFMYGRIDAWGSGKADNAVWKNNIEANQRQLKSDIRSLDSLYSEKNKFVNARIDQTVEILRVVAENQTVMINQQNNLSIVVTKMCKRIDGMADDAQFLKMKEAGSMINPLPKIDNHKKPEFKDNKDNLLLPSPIDSTFGQLKIVRVPCNTN